jgi:hypothetical protein
MTDRIPVKANFTGSDVTSLGEFASSDSISIAHGGTGAVNAAAARTALGLAIGTNVQAYDATIVVDGDIGTSVQAYDADTAKLDAAANFTQALQKSGSDVLVTGDVTNANFTGADLEIAKGGTGASSASAARTALGLAIGSDVQAFNAAIMVDGDIGSSVQAYDSDTSKTDVAETRSAAINMADQIVQRPLLQDYSEKTVAMGSATAVNLEDGNVFSKTISGTTTLTFTNPSSVGTSSFSLILTNAGSATLNFPTVKWPAATAPTLTASGIDVLVFVYHGSTWYGIASGIGMA